MANVMQIATKEDEELKYPNDFADEVTKRWTQLKFPPSSPQNASITEPQARRIVLRGVESACPDLDILKELVGILYHVSFLTEESRKLAVRISYLTPEDFKNKSPDERLTHNHPVVFSSPIPFTTKEVMRLAPSIDPTRSVLVICRGNIVGSSGSLVIWGIMHLGDEWWRLTSGRSSGAMVPPRCLTLSTFAPGNITATVSGTVLLRLQNGHFLSDALQGLRTGPVARFLQSGADKLYQETLQRLGLQKFSQNPDEDSVPQRLYYQVFENILKFAAEHRHGATFVIFPDGTSADDSRLKKRIVMKYSTGASALWPELLAECVAYHKYFGHMSEGGSLLQNANATPSQLKEMHVWNGIWESKQQVVTGLESFIADLSGVDGVVVLSTGCKLLGFGGEIIVPNATEMEVKEARDTNATKLTPVKIDSYGTRHRSAFRLCSSFEDCIVLIVSQDGGAKAVKRIGEHVVLWNNVDLRPYAL